MVMSSQKKLRARSRTTREEKKNSQSKEAGEAEGFPEESPLLVSLYIPVCIGGECASQTGGEQS